MENRFRRRLFQRLCRIAKPFWVSEKRRRALALLFVVLALLGAVLGVNVWTTSIAGRFATALQNKNTAAYEHLLLVYLGALLLATPLAVAYGYFRSIVALEWREWLTGHFVAKYFSRRAYYTLSRDSEIDNPDERMSHDIETFCNMTVGLSIAAIDALVTVVMFLRLLWEISPALTFIAAAYSLVGCIITAIIGGRLVPLNAEALKVEADMRYSMARVRRDVEAIAFYRGEQRATAHVMKLLRRVIRNGSSIIIVNRNLSCFTSSFASLIVLIPAAIVAPLYFHGAVDFGEITRAGMAFSNVFTGLSLFVAQFGALSSYAANIERLGSFLEKLDDSACGSPGSAPSLIKMKEGPLLQLERVTIRTPDGMREVVRDLTLACPPGARLMITGPSGGGKSSILRAMAGLWSTGSGTIVRPPLSQVMFLPQQPYVPAGTLREALCYPRTSDAATTASALAMLEVVGLGYLLERSGGLDVEQNWTETLSPGEQQRLCFARLLLAEPRFAILDEATSALDLKHQRTLYTLLRHTGATVISVGHRDSLKEHHEFILELTGSGEWKLHSSGYRDDAPTRVTAAA